MNRLIFRQTRIADPGGSHSLSQLVDVLVEAGKITRIAASLEEKAGETDREYEGGVLSPGWIDLRVHLTDPGEEYKESLTTLAAAAANGGFAQVVTLPNAHPPMDNAGAIHALLSRSRDLPVRIRPAGALSEGAAGTDLAELYDMHQAGALAFTDGLHPTANTGLLLRGLQYLKAFNGLLMDFPLEQSLVRNAQVAEGIPATQLGLPGVPEIAETLAVDRALQVLDHFPGRLHLGPLTTAKSVQQVAAAKANHTGLLSSEVSALYLLLSDDDLLGFDPNVKLWPPLRAESDRKALVQAVIDGHIDVVSSGHHPQSIEEKQHDFVTAAWGASTLETAFSAAWTALQPAGAPLLRLVELLAKGPRRVLGLPVQPVEEGAEMDLTWFDPDAEWTPAASDFRSRSKFSPLLGRSLRGRPLGVLSRGRWTEGSGATARRR